MTRRSNPLTAVAYLRVSTERQELGPDAQRAMIEAWAAREGVSVVAWHVDQGVSGATPVDERPGFLAALASVREHRAGVLVAAKRDRIARDIVVAATAEKAVTTARAVLRTTDRAPIAGASGRLAAGIDDLFSAHEREIIRERTTAALAAKKAKGECVGRVPYGWRLAADGVHLERDEDEQAVIATIRDLAASGMSRRAIVAELASRGAVSRVGRPLQVTQVGRILAAAAA